MGRWAWVPSPCPRPGLCAFLLLLLLLVPRRTQPQALGVSTTAPGSVAKGSLCPLQVPGLRPEGPFPRAGGRAGGPGQAWG